MCWASLHSAQPTNAIYLDLTPEFAEFVYLDLTPEFVTPEFVTPEF